MTSAARAMPVNRTILFEKEKHWDLLCSWWLKRLGEHPDFEALPAIGILIEQSGVPISAGFLTGTDGPLAIIGYLVSDPDSDREARSVAVDYSIGILMEIARSRGFKIVSAAAEGAHIVGRFKKHGFRVYTENVVHLGRKI